MKATPGCGSIRVWLHFELIFLSLESQTPILLLIRALIHNQAHPLPVEWAGKYKTITVGDSWLCIKTGADLKVIRVHYLRIHPLTIVSLMSSFCIDLCTRFCSLSFLQFYAITALCSFGLGLLCLYMAIDWFSGQQEHFTPQLLSLFVFSNRGTSTVDEI